MRLKVEFKYQCEVEVKEEEIDKLKDNLKKDRFIQGLSKEINQVFLQDDGRTEAGGIVDFDYKLEED